jgi:hypothetical protein
MQIYQRKILFLQTLRASLNVSGTLGVRPQRPDKYNPRDTQSAAKTKPHPYTAQGTQALSAPPEHNKTTGPPDSLEAKAK